MERKNIKELTEEEAKEIYDFVAVDNDELWSFTGLAKEPIIEEDGSMRVTMGLRPIVGIKYRNSNHDGCLLPFDDTRVMLWLYRNGYEIEDLMEYNKDLTKVEQDLDNLAFAIHWNCKEDNKHTIESLKKRLLECADTYFYETNY